MPNQEQKWTPEETKKLVKLAGKMSGPQIAKILKRTRDSVKGKIERMGLPKFDRSAKPIVIAPVPPPEPPKPVAVPQLRQPIKPLRQKAPSREYAPLEYCPECHAPVSNWSDHLIRMPECRKRA